MENTLKIEAMKTVQVLVLAAGRSTRIKDNITKMLHQIGDMKILARVLRNIRKAGFFETTLILGHQKDAIQREFPEYPFIHQKELLGTGHAVLQAKDLYKGDQTLVLFGDKPLLKPETIKEFALHHCLDNTVITVSTVIHPIPENYSEGYGTVVRDNSPRPKVIALRKAEGTNECDGGMYIFNTAWLWKNIERLQPKDVRGKQEFLLPDLVEIAHNDGFGIGDYRITDYREATGINTPEQRLEAESYLDEL